MTMALLKRGRRILSLWLPRAAAEGARRRRGADPDLPLAVLAEERGALRVASLTASAERRGARLGQSAADARAVLPELTTDMADPAEAAAFAAALRRWALRFCPWVAEDRSDETPAFGVARPAGSGPPRFRGDLALALDVTGSTHLFGGEAALIERMTETLADLGFTAQAGLADGLGAAWALARYGTAPRIAPPGGARVALAPLPPAALRLEPAALEGLARLGVASVETLAALPRGATARRFGPATLRRLDQAFGSEPEPIAPQPPPAPYAVRLSLPEPIGRLEDLKAGLDRLLARLCARLEAEGLGARRLILDLRRVDRAIQRLETALARPGREPARIARLFARALEQAEAGYGIDAIRLEAVWVEPLAPRQTETATEAQDFSPRDDAALATLLTTLGGRLGFDRLIRLAPGESHAPDRAVIALSAVDPAPKGLWSDAARRRPPRPLQTFAPEPVILERPPGALAPGSSAPGSSASSPRAGWRFRWRGAVHETATAAGPERIAPEWWLDDPAWARGLRDYWRIETREGLRLWLFETPEAPETQETGARWFAAGRFA